MTKWVPIILLAVIGCDQRTTSQATPEQVVAPATQPVAIVYPAPVYPTRSPAVLNIDGHDVAFPAATLSVVNFSDGTLSLRLCSDDPPSAIDPGYVGNSFLFDFKLVGESQATLAGYAWENKSVVIDGTDGDAGIFLHGLREQLHPTDVKVTFHQDGADLSAVITGSFTHTDTRNPMAPPESVQVFGSLRSPTPVK